MPFRLTGISNPMGYEALRLRDSAQRQLELCKADAARKGNPNGHKWLAGDAYCFFRVT